ncbi:hypothetical protein HDU76_013676 [Blyttiomyces sp. JEL0837]|nr:hypothetical protein HDU76_013676 [Blyttiomyces sp. JEL0837]
MTAMTSSSSSSSAAITAAIASTRTSIMRSNSMLLPSSRYNPINSRCLSSASHIHGIPTIARTAEQDITKLRGSTASSTTTSPSPSSTAPSSSAKWSKQPLYADPEFEVVNNGLGSVMVVKLPRTSRFFGAIGNAIGMSSTVDSRLTTVSGLPTAILRKLTGDTLYQQEFWTAANPGDVVIAPRKPGDIAVIKMDGSTEYVVNRKAFLAATGKLAVVTSTHSAASSVDALFHYRVTGSGTLAISSNYGGLYRVVLDQHEEYLVSASHLIAWDAVMEPRPENESAAPTKSTPASTQSGSLSLTKKEGETVAHVVGRILGTLARATWNAAKWTGWALVRRGKKVTSGHKGFYRLRGPGELFISSRIEPSLSWLKDVRPVEVKLGGKSTKQ